MKSASARDEADSLERRPPGPDAAIDGYRYQVQVHGRQGLVRRWHGRVVTTDARGRRHYWRWCSSFSKARLIAMLWEHARRDIEWRTGRVIAVEVIEISS